jgi:hypothetical protein
MDVSGQVSFRPLCLQERSKCIRGKTDGELMNRDGRWRRIGKPAPTQFTNAISFIRPAATDKAAYRYFYDIAEKQITSLSITFREKNQL